MEYYAVEAVRERRLAPEDGNPEYLVTWSGYPKSSSMWEPRTNLVRYCADKLQVIDEREMQVTDEQIDAWRTRHGLVDATTALPRTTPPASSKQKVDQKKEPVAPDVEVLSGIVLRDYPATSPSANERRGKLSSPSEGGEVKAHHAPSVLLLGELIMTEEAASALAQPTSKKRRREAVADSMLDVCEPAAEVEHAWRSLLGVSLMHSVSACRRTSGAHENFSIDAGDVACLTDVERHIGDSLEIVGLAPPETTADGLPYADPVSCIALVGEEESERLRRVTTADNPSLTPTIQELLRPQKDQLVVRYILHGDCEEGQPRILSIPLSVFRFAFPQLLLDYLLTHSAIMEM